MAAGAVVAGVVVGCEVPDADEVVVVVGSTDVAGVVEAGVVDGATVDVDGALDVLVGSEVSSPEQAPTSSTTAVTAGRHRRFMRPRPRRPSRQEAPARVEPWPSAGDPPEQRVQARTAPQ